MVASDVTGMGIMALAGALLCAQNALSGGSRAFGVHFFYLYGLAAVFGALMLFAVALRRGKLSQMQKGKKWVVLRGTGGAGVWVLLCLAVASDAPLGDTSALSSINVVLAALLGRAFLGEALRGLHLVALLMSVCGALLISKPGFIFGSEEGFEVPVVGYSFALASGFTSGLTFIAARRAQDVDSSLMTASVMLQEGIVTMVLPMLGIVNELPLSLLFDSPLKVAASVFFFLILAVFSCGTMSLGAQMCPAAVGSTIFSAASMSLGYALQTLLHNEAPERVTLIGAALMLLAVALMALARKLYSEPVSCPRACVDTSSEGSHSGMQSQETDDRTSESSVASHGSSLASFVASEWSGVRLRPVAAISADRSSVPVAQSLGLASA